MSGKKIIGVTVGTPLSPQTIKEKLKKDGFYPVISVSTISNGYRITITDTNGTKTVDVMDGKDGYTPKKGVDYFDGKDGKAGKDGYTPRKGVDYFDGADGQPGKDGYTPIKGKDYFDGQPGKDGYTPVKGKDYFDGADGKDGVDGKTPIKGTDYFTAADKAEMVSAVIAQLPVYNGEVVSV